MIPCVPPGANGSFGPDALVCVMTETLPPAALSPPTATDPTAAIMACGSTVDPGTLQAIIRVESGSRPLAINVNHLPSQPPPARDAATAVAVASHWISLGYSVDLGLMQVNSRNLSALGYTVSQMFDPCTNVRAGAAILTADYLSARATRPDPQIALQAALSDYNSGTFDRGFWNGYVSKYYGPAATAAGFPHIITAGFRALPTSIPPNPYTADPSVYTRKDTPLD